MKTILLILIAVFTIFNCNAQCTNGHKKPKLVISTNLSCPTDTLFYNDSTVVINRGCNTIQYTCEACGQVVKEVEKDNKTIIWRRVIVVYVNGKEMNLRYNSTLGDALRAYSHSNQLYKKAYNGELVVRVNGYKTDVSGGIKHGDKITFKE